jgi:hypothetical protein
VEKEEIKIKEWREEERKRKECREGRENEEM